MHSSRSSRGESNISREVVALTPVCLDQLLAMANDGLQHLEKRGSFAGQTQTLFNSLNDFLQAVHALKPPAPNAKKPGKKERFCSALASPDFSMSEFGWSFVKGKLSQSFGGEGNGLTRVLRSFEKLYQLLKSSGDHIIQISNDEDLQIIALTLYLVDYLINPPDVRDKLVLTKRIAQRIDLPAKRNLIQEKCIVLRSRCCDRLKDYLKNEVTHSKYKTLLAEQRNIQDLLQAHTNNLLQDAQNVMNDKDLLEHVNQALQSHVQALKEAYRSASLFEVDLLQGADHPRIEVRPTEDRALLSKLISEVKLAQDDLARIHFQTLTPAQEAPQYLVESGAVEAAVSAPVPIQEVGPVSVEHTTDAAIDKAEAGWEELQKMAGEELKKSVNVEAGTLHQPVPAEMTATSREDDDADENVVAASPLFQSAAADSGEKLTVQHIDQFIRMFEEEFDRFEQLYEAMASKEHYQETKQLVDGAKILLGIFKESDILKPLCCSVLQKKSISVLQMARIKVQVASVLAYYGILSPISPLSIAKNTIRNIMGSRFDSGHFVFFKNGAELQFIIMGLYILDRLLNAPPIMDAGDFKDQTIQWAFWTVPPAKVDLDGVTDIKVIEARQAQAAEERKQALKIIMRKHKEKYYPIKSGFTFLRNSTCFTLYEMFSSQENIAWKNQQIAYLEHYNVLQEEAKALLANCSKLSEHSDPTRLTQYLEKLKAAYSGLPEWVIRVDKSSETVIGPSDVPYPEVVVKGYARMVPIRRLLEKTKLKVEAEQKRLVSIEKCSNPPPLVAPESQSPVVGDQFEREPILSPARPKAMLDQVCEVYRQAIQKVPIPFPPVLEISAVSDQSDIDRQVALIQIKASLLEARSQVNNIQSNLIMCRGIEKYFRLFNPHHTSMKDLKTQLSESLILRQKISDWSNQLQMISDTFDGGSDDNSQTLAGDARRVLEACQRCHAHLMALQVDFVTKNQDTLCAIEKFIKQQAGRAASFNAQHRVELHDIESELTGLAVLRNQFDALSAQFGVMQDTFQNTEGNEALLNKINQSLGIYQDYHGQLVTTQQTLLDVKEKQLSLNKRDAARVVLVATMIAHCESYLVERSQSFLGMRDRLLQFLFGWLFTFGQKQRELYVRDSLETALDHYGTGKIKLDTLLEIIGNGKRQFKGGSFASGLLKGFEETLKLFGAKKLAAFKQVEEVSAKQTICNQLRKKACEAYSAILFSKSNHAFFRSKQYAAQAQAWAKAAEDVNAFEKYIETHKADDRFAKWSSAFELLTPKL